MESDLKERIERIAAAAHAGTKSFGEIVAALIESGVESYRVDYRQRETSYFLGANDVHTVTLPVPQVPIADAFDPEALLAAIRGSQQGLVKYPEFLDRSMRAGCVGYVVWIAGRHVTYFGRREETHVEHFPKAKT